MLIYSQAQFDTKNVIYDHKLQDIETLHKWLENSNTDYRICYVKGDSILFGRDIFGRKSLCGRLHKSNNGITRVEITAGFFDKKCIDCFEFPPGALYTLKDVKNITASGQRIFFDLAEDYCMSTELSISTYYKLIDTHPFYSLFKNVKIIEIDSTAYLHPSRNFNVDPTVEEVNSMADELIKRLSLAVKEAFEPSLLMDEGLLDGHRGATEQVSICFSGGVDSLTITLLAALSLPNVKQFNLINTVFGESEKDFNSRSDRKKAMECFEFLIKRFGSDKFSMILVNVDRTEIAKNRSKIEAAMLPCYTILDESLASVVWFGSRAKGIQVFASNHQGLEFKPSNCALVGSGADELLGGYARHRTTFEQGGWIRLHEEMSMEISRIGARNFGRDDRIALSNDVHLLAPFMSDDFVKWITTIPLSYRVDFREARGLGEKRLLRIALRRLGLPSNLTDTPKKAMQFGSGYAKLENKGKKGGDTSIEISS